MSALPLTFIHVRTSTVKIAACFFVFYSCLTGVFILTVKLNMMAGGDQVSYVYIYRRAESNEESPI